MNGLLIIAYIIPAIAVVTGVFIAVGRTLGRIDALTGAVDRLNGVVDKLADKTIVTLADHEIRLTRIEDQISK